jgi:hypothetical protein
LSGLDQVYLQKLFTNEQNITAIFKLIYNKHKHIYSIKVIKNTCTQTQKLLKMPSLLKLGG